MIIRSCERVLAKKNSFNQIKKKEEERMYIFMISDGVLSSNQMLLGEDIDAESVWKNYVVPFVLRKESDRLAHAEIMNMAINGCQPVRRYLFYYGNSDISKHTFLEIMAQSKIPNVSVVIGLIPSVRHTAHPLLESTRTGAEVDVSSLSSSTGGDEQKWTHDIGFVLRELTPGRPSTAVALHAVDHSIAEQVFQSIHDGAVFELSYHSQCGPVKRYFFHYDPRNLPAARNLLLRIVQPHKLSFPHPVKGSYVIRFVPRTHPSTVSHYPTIIDASDRSVVVVQ